MDQKPTALKNGCFILSSVNFIGKEVKQSHNTPIEAQGVDEV
jgi:hypothetical protein